MEKPNNPRPLRSERAAALLPPLAVVGIALTNDRPYIGLNAGVLFVTNLVAIILGAAATFRMVGVHAALSGDEAPHWVRNTVVILVLASLALSAPLIMRLTERQLVGQTRPLTYPVSAKVRDAVDKFIAGSPGIELIMVGRINAEPNSDVTVMVGTRRVLPYHFKENLTEVVQRARQYDVHVRIFAFWQSGEETEKPDKSG
jgi:hypothetical protein